MNFASQRGKIVIPPKLVIDRSKFPAADDEYTPRQRRIINARLAEAEKGPYYGPFRSVAKVEASLEKWKARGKPQKLKKTG